MLQLEGPVRIQDLFSEIGYPSLGPYPCADLNTQLEVSQVKVSIHQKTAKVRRKPCDCKKENQGKAGSESDRFCGSIKERPTWDMGNGVKVPVSMGWASDQPNPNLDVSLPRGPKNPIDPGPELNIPKRPEIDMGNGVKVPISIGFPSDGSNPNIKPTLPEGPKKPVEPGQEIELPKRPKIDMGNGVKVPISIGWPSNKRVSKSPE